MLHCVSFKLLRNPERFYDIITVPLIFPWVQTGFVGLSSSFLVSHQTNRISPSFSTHFSHWSASVLTQSVKFLDAPSPCTVSHTHIYVNAARISIPTALLKFNSINTLAFSVLRVRVHQFSPFYRSCFFNLSAVLPSCWPLQELQCQRHQETLWRILQHFSG